MKASQSERVATMASASGPPCATVTSWPSNRSASAMVVPKGPPQKYVVLDAHEGPDVLIVVVVDAVHQVEDDVGIGRRRREGVPVHPDPSRRRHFREDLPQMVGAEGLHGGGADRCSAKLRRKRRSRTWR